MEQEKILSELDLPVWSVVTDDHGVTDHGVTRKQAELMAVENDRRGVKGSTIISADAAARYTRKVRVLEKRETPPVSKLSTLI
jgi:hypothetical protein